ncbi:anti-sigma factor antagonist [Anaerobacillus alkaliphilus]|uniref:Anti-sigma factor antagonist n=1 Tax=Anaerobacillus alkaliphilus TaxID=1548597 RepID=A0A4Q0VU77_9BACI|nr:STAS domain-containing protein [Anaerobacillus alkaliphilus]RXJ02061.1 anti-sigma factor antagonist [Anaerobacillus alkaliphilus]
MKINTKVLNNIVHLTLEGKMYVQESIIVREEVLSQFEKGYKDFYFNMKDLEYIDSSGLGVLVGLHKKAIEQNGKVSIENLQGPVKELFELTRLNLVFDIR